MNEISLREKLIIFARGKRVWINGGEFERLAMDNGYKAANSGRRCRELENAGIFERAEKNGSVWYRYKPQNALEKINQISPFKPKAELKQISLFQ